MSKTTKCTECYWLYVPELTEYYSNPSYLGPV